MFTKDVRLSLTNLKRTEPHIHPGLQCIFLLKGSAVLEIAGKEVCLNTEDLLVINSNQIHFVKEASSNITVILEISKEYISAENEEQPVGNIQCHCIGYSDESSHYYGLKQALTRMLYISMKKEEQYRLDFKVELLRFIYILLAGFQIDEPESKRHVGPIKTIDDILSYIDKKSGYPLSLEDVADKAFMSPKYFSKYFKRKTGYGFLKYLTSLRVKKAVQSLTDTEDSIVKIALDNGFANAKAFNDAFKKAYGDTPGQFRKKYQNPEPAQKNETDWIEVNLELDIELKDFLRYVKKYDISTEQTNLKKIHYDVKLEEKSAQKLKLQENILNIGRVETAGYTNLRQQVEILRNRLGFRYVYFALDPNFIPNNIQYNLILHNQFFRAVDYFRKNHLFPFLKLSFEPFYKGWKKEVIIEDVEEQITIFFTCIQRQYSKEFLAKWRVEVCVEKEQEIEESMAFYQTVYRGVKKNVPDMQVGLRALYTTAGLPGNFDIFLKYAKENKLLPDFLTFTVFPKEKSDQYLATQFFYTGLRGCYKEAVEAIKEACSREKVQSPPLYMIEWNTLMGDLANESILYFRSALIIEALLDLKEDISGAGYWADSAVSTGYSKDLPMTSLALYILDDVRRPVHSVLEVMNRIGENIIYEGENILVTQMEKYEYGILLWNPQYLNPSYSLDDSTTEALAKNVNVRLTKIPTGVYQIKKITCNKEHSGSISQIVNAGYPEFTDLEVFEYIQHDIANGLNVYEEYVFNDTYDLNTNLSYNSVVLYVIRKK